MGIMGIVWMILVGFVVGVLARFFYPGAVGLGFWMTALLGIGAHEPCLALHRRSWSKGHVVTVVTLTYPASRYALYSRYRTSPSGTLSQ